MSSTRKLSERVELIYCIREACRENPPAHILPLEKEWERERLSCSLFAGDDERKRMGHLKGLLFIFHSLQVG